MKWLNIMLSFRQWYVAGQSLAFIIIPTNSALLSGYCEYGSQFSC
jgi:hypothetical protein